MVFGNHSSPSSREELGTMGKGGKIQQLSIAGTARGSTTVCVRATQGQRGESPEEGERQAESTPTWQGARPRAYARGGPKEGQRRQTGIQSREPEKETQAPLQGEKRAPVGSADLRDTKSSSPHRGLSPLSSLPVSLFFPYP